jgi:hypothetical protein
VRRGEVKCEGKRETDIFRGAAIADNVPALTGRRGQLSRHEFWLAEVVNCTVVADLGPWSFRPVTVSRVSGNPLYG